MNIYIKNDAIQKLTLSQEQKWLEEKPVDADAHAYLCDRYIKTQGKNVRHLFSESSESEFLAQELEKEKAVELNKLNSETKEAILSKYSIEKQLNILASGDNVAIADMSAVITEIRNKGKIAKSKIIE